MTSTPQIHRLATGQERLLNLPAGGELFCRQGALRLDCPLLGQSLVLHTGQGWRAGEALWVRLAPAGSQPAVVENHGGPPVHGN